MNKSNFPRFISLDKPITGLNGSRIMKYSNFLRFIPDQIYIRMLWRAKMHTKLNLANPQTFNEKLQWLKLNDRKPQYTQMVDKAAVKEYVASIIGDKYIIPTLYTYEYFEDIDFSRLPDQFVLKCTHDSGGLCVCRDKAQFDIENNMPQALEKVNARSNKEEYIGTNGVHPTMEGYLQIGDVFYRALVADLNKE